MDNAMVRIRTRTRTSRIRITHQWMDKERTTHRWMDVDASVVKLKRMYIYIYISLICVKYLN